LEQRLTELEKKLDELQRERHRQTARFPRRHHVKHPKKPGRPAGHKPEHRPPPDHVDRVIEVPMQQCPDCHVPLVDMIVHTQFQTDLPPVTPRTRRRNRLAHQSAECLALGVQLGDRDDLRHPH
jgi:hypothetical protein